MKMFYGNTPINSMKIKHYELNTNDCDMVASDLQAGKTAVARGKKITGTGKSFEFASYGTLPSNFPMPIPGEINTVLVSCKTYPLQLNLTMDECKQISFSDSNLLGKVYMNLDNNSMDYVNFIVQAKDNRINIICDANLEFEIFYGKDNYV